MPVDVDVWVFGAFEFDLGRGELRRDGAAIRLAPQPFKALQLLLSDPGVLITRDQLRLALWGEDRYVDFNAGLNFCIGQLRTALDDPATRSAIIVTIPRRGYRFVADVQRRAPADVGRPPAAAEVVAPGFAARSSASVRRWWMAAAAIAFAVLTAPARDPLVVHVPLSRSLVALKEYELGASGLADASPADLPTRAARLEAAVNADPAFAQAYATLADARLIIGNYRLVSPQIAYASAKAAAMKAVSLDPSLAEAHAVYAASLLYLDWDWRQADAHFTRAIKAGSTSARVHQWYSRYLSASGRHDEALRHATLAADLSPRSISAMTDLGNAALRAGRLDQAQMICAEASALMPQFLPARWCVAAAAAEAGRFDVAAGYGIRNRSGAASFWSERATRLLETADSDAERVRRSVSVAVALAHDGRSSDAIDWLERGANARIDEMLFVRGHPAFQVLASDPRFVRVLQRVGR